MLKTYIFIICLYAVNILLADNVYPQQKRVLIKLKDDYKYQHWDGVPTKLGIDWYVEDSKRQKVLLHEYQVAINDSLYNDIYFRTETPKKFNGVLAYNTLSLNSDCEIVVYDLEKFRDFEYDSTKNINYGDEDYFVKSTIFHEVSHYYFYQTVIEMQRLRHLHVNEYFSMGISSFPNQELQYGSKFIEEGLCEYVTQHYKWSPRFNSVVKPQKKDFRDKNMKFEVQYIYASSYVKDFLDNYVRQYGRPKIGIVIILGNRPPSYEEILKPQSYFDRLNQQKNSEFTQSY